MAHCGYEPTAADDAFKNPLKLFQLGRKGIKTEGPMAKEIPLDQARPAQYVHDDLVAGVLQEAHQKPADEKPAAEAQKDSASKVRLIG
jgi:hypothetical protein